MIIDIIEFLVGCEEVAVFEVKDGSSRSWPRRARTRPVRGDRAGRGADRPHGAHGPAVPAGRPGRRRGRPDGVLPGEVPRFGGVRHHALPSPSAEIRAAPAHRPRPPEPPRRRGRNGARVRLAPSQRTRGCRARRLDARRFRLPGLLPGTAPRDGQVPKAAERPTVRASISIRASSRDGGPSSSRPFSGPASACASGSGDESGGANHFLLPYLTRGDGSSCRFGPTAMETLAPEMLALGCEKRNLTARMFGGRVAVRGSGGRVSIGAQNVAVAARFLEERGSRSSNRRSAARGGGRSFSTRKRATSS